MTKNKENDNEDKVNVSILIEITRQKLANAIILNTELEALVIELKTKIAELEKNS
jgi:hypothetical protein